MAQDIIGIGRNHATTDESMAYLIPSGGYAMEQHAPPEQKDGRKRKRFSADEKKSFASDLALWAEHDNEDALKQVQDLLRSNTGSAVGQPADDEQEADDILEHITNPQALKAYYQRQMSKNQSVDPEQWLQWNLSALYSAAERRCFRIDLKSYNEQEDEGAYERIGSLFASDKVVSRLGVESRISNPEDREDVVMKAIERASAPETLKDAWGKHGIETDPVALLRTKLRGAVSDYRESQKTLLARNTVPMPEGYDIPGWRGGTISAFEYHPELIWERIQERCDEATAQALWARFVDELTDVQIGQILCLPREEVNRRIKNAITNPDFQQCLTTLLL